MHPCPGLDPGCAARPSGPRSDRAFVRIAQELVDLVDIDQVAAVDPEKHLTGETFLDRAQGEGAVELAGPGPDDGIDVVGFEKYDLVRMEQVDFTVGADRDPHQFLFGGDVGGDVVKQDADLLFGQLRSTTDH